MNRSRIKILIGAIASACAAAALIAPAADAAPAQARIAIYDGVEAGPNTGIIFGQIFSRRSDCRSARPVKLVVASGGGREVVDRGLSSDEGGISGLVTFDEFDSADAVYFLAPKVKRHGKTICARTKEPITLAKAPSTAAKPVPTAVTIVDIDGEGSNGTVAGLVITGPGGRPCLAGRKVTLLVDGDRVDRGTTTGRGAFGLHITAAEAEGSTSIKVKLKRSKLPNGKVCGGDSDLFEAAA